MDKDTDKGGANDPTNYEVIERIRHGVRQVERIGERREPKYVRGNESSKKSR